MTYELVVEWTTYGVNLDTGEPIREGETSSVERTVNINRICYEERARIEILRNTLLLTSDYNLRDFGRARF